MTVIRTREGFNVIASAAANPKVVQVELSADRNYLTFAGDVAAPGRTVRRFAVIGTAYGALFTMAGDIRFWTSRSGAAAAARRYQTLFEER